MDREHARTVVLRRVFPVCSPMVTACFPPDPCRPAPPADHKDAMNATFSATERELTIHQRGLVDASLEEGEILSAISLLDQMRSQHTLPPIIHLRLLIYICLVPPAEDFVDLLLEKQTGTEPLSPRKLAKKTANPITPAVVAAAHTLLFSYILTNSPAAIARALPSPPNRADPDIDIESTLVQDASCISKAQTCWDILQVGFTTIPRPDFSTPKLSRIKRRRPSPERLEPSDTHFQDDNGFVSEHAWKVLNWLLSVFERDEELRQKSSSSQTPLLVDQISFIHGQSSIRWILDPPLTVIFQALKQTEPDRKQMGARLLSLLVQLSFTAHLDQSAFVSAILRRLPSLSLPDLTEFLSLFGGSPQSLRIKIALCYQLITGTPRDDSVSNATSSRAQPRAVRKQRNQLDHATPTFQNAGFISTKDLPNPTEILTAVEVQTNNFVASPPEITLRKLQKDLIMAYGTFYAGPGNDGHQKQEWIVLLRSGEIRQRLVNWMSTIGDNDWDQRYMISVIQLWEQSLLR
ncbi:hypothetical protein BDN72DRAFT_655848 [Pluteus cervinus]|uniref:Uncharacterized protein n=1 Tax=Pluteus cervinus TaxID=181527 RepID=A0ACD3ASI2_9AGAR|nr:hypothetical protein BDN72DRAFT_655848 [Pluteus cervinus]